MISAKKFEIPHKQTGKLLIAQNDDETKLLPQVLRQARASGAEGVRLTGRDEVRRLEPRVRAHGAVLCPTSGVVDSHALLQHYEQQFLDHGGEIVYNTEVTGIEKIDDGKGGYVIEVNECNLAKKEPIYAESTTKVETRYLINCAGVMSNKISKCLGIESKDYEIHPTKGMYFRVHQKLEQYPEMLVYPLPSTSIVGIHTCPDLYGGMRLGPYEQWFPDEEIGHINTSADRSFVGGSAFPLMTPEELGPFFVDSCKSYLPFLELEDISPDIVGIHPKLQSKGQPMRDWIIQHEADKGLHNLINLVGIESPGLTASPAIGQHVAQMLASIVS